MSLQDGDVVRFDYVLWVDDGKKPLETNQEAVAKEHGMHDPERPYRPMTVTLGGRQIIPGLEKELSQRGKKGASFSVDLAAADAYGDRDVHKVKDIPMAQFRKHNVKPEVGLVLNYEGQRAIIQRVAGGRVRLDMNHELAGKRLRYDITVRDIVTDDAGKVEAVIADMFGEGNAKVEIGKDAITLEVPDQAKFDPNWPQAKFRVLNLLRQAAGLDKAIKLVETYPAMNTPEVSPTPGATKKATSKPGAAGGEEE